MFSQENLDIIIIIIIIIIITKKKIIILGFETGVKFCESLHPWPSFFLFIFYIFGLWSKMT